MGEPVEQLGADGAPPLATAGVAGNVVIAMRAVLAGDEQNDPRAHGERLADAPDEAGVGHLEAHAVKVYRDVGLDGAARELAVP